MQNSNNEAGAFAVPVSAEEVEKERMRTRVAEITSSKHMVVTGFLLSLLGVALYCYATLAMSESDSRLVAVSLAVVAGGFIVWLIGTIGYFNQAIESGDPDAVL
jgi:hypothetical protein